MTGDKKLASSDNSYIAFVSNNLSRVSGPDRQGWYTALCPFHDDRNHPNLRYSETGFRCMACGEKGGIKKLARKLGMNEIKSKSRLKHISATYDYKDENGELIFQVVRYEPKTFRQRRPDKNGGWIWDLNGIRSIVYRLPEILATPLEQMIFIVEGEKSADMLVDNGLVATCSPMGAGKWHEEYNQIFANRKVAILPDDDEPGRYHAEEVASNLTPFAAEVKVVKLPNLGKGQDVYDWFCSGKTIQDLLDIVESQLIQKPVNGADVLNSIVVFLKTYVVLTKSQIDVIALWVAHTYLFDLAETTPYLDIHSPEKRSGKTRLLESLDLIVYHAWFTGRVTPAVLARKIDAECPTLLLDESDAAFKGDKEYSQTLRGILNTGYRRGGKTSVCVGQGANISYRDLSTFCPKAIAGIGKLPDTIADRSIPIVLKRRAQHEFIQRFRRRTAEKEASIIIEAIQQWVRETPQSDYEPDMPSELDDRAMDCLEPLFAIADVVGGEWSSRASQAAIELMVGIEREDTSTGIKLLHDIRYVFNNREKIFSNDLVTNLVQIEESPWGDLNTRKLAAMLKPYGINPKTTRIGEKSLKGYRRADFIDAFNRYLPDDAVTSVTTVTLHSNEDEIEASNDPSQTPQNDSNVTDGSRSWLRHNVTDVTDKTGVIAGKGEKNIVLDEWETEI